MKKLNYSLILAVLGITLSIKTVVKATDPVLNITNGTQTGRVDTNENNTNINDNENNTLKITGSNGITISVTDTSQGATVNVSAAGVVGTPGATGPTGATGATGAVGATGATGPKGDKGDKGDQGNVGIVGTIEANGGTDGSVENPTQLNLIGTGITVSNDEGAASADFSNLQTNQGNTNTETLNVHTDRIQRNSDNIFQTQIDVTKETTDRISGDKVLQENIDGEATTRANADRGLQAQLNSANSNMSLMNGRVNELDSRVHRLEEMKYVFDVGVRLYDAKHFSLVVFDTYDVRHSENFMAGVRTVFKLGKSYEQKQCDRQARVYNNSLQRMEAHIQRLENEIQALRK